MNFDDKLELIKLLNDVYPDLDIVIFTKDDKGQLIINDRTITRFNAGIASRQLQEDRNATISQYFRLFSEDIEKKYIAKKAYFNKGQGRPTKNLTESQIRSAMANTKSNMAAARYLHVSYNTYKKYAKMYTDTETGKTLLDVHKNENGIGIIKGRASGKKLPLEDIFANKHPNYNLYSLKKRLVNEQILEEKCCLCGYDERRWQDGKTPLVVDFIDGDDKNMNRDNLRLLCYNCSFQVRGSMNKKQLKSIERDIYETKKRISEKEQNELFDKFQRGLN